MDPRKGPPYGLPYRTIAASQTAQLLGNVGRAGDLLTRLIIVPATLSPGTVAIKDGNGSDITVFTGGANSITELKPIVVELGAYALATTTPGWRVTTGAAVSVIAVGFFS